MNQLNKKIDKQDVFIDQNYQDQFDSKQHLSNEKPSTNVKYPNQLEEECNQMGFK